MILEHLRYANLGTYPKSFTKNAFEHFTQTKPNILDIFLCSETDQDELERGDVPKSIQCYMNETGASEEDARKHIRFLISETWNKMNEEAGAASSPFSRTFIEIVMNLARTAQCIYLHGDGHGVEDRETKDNVLSLIIHPIPLHKDEHEATRDSTLAKV
jgi:hypothetical protein